MNPGNKDEFAAAWEQISPEQIRNALDDDEAKELLNRATGKWYALKDGELMEMES